ncbi:hypothetical protein J2W51_001608 [Tardiphaga robiniae]|uniref:hypothetical protein n=1 Tax=Tardiphaga robiniae TaxID=943830 RepID=UPI0028601771|nr:hypothetical protein [Tardiphaga robiniae]MDR6659066.1 hypothetical protein [Tardiphaga robiniae]
MKVLLSKEELEREALLEMRSHPCCGTLKAVDVEYSDIRADSNWALYAFSEGRIDPSLLQAALEATAEKLRRRYELRAPDDAGKVERPVSTPLADLRHEL